MYNFGSGSKCHLCVYSSWLQKLIYINVRLLPVEGNVIGQVWTRLSGICNTRAAGSKQKRFPGQILEDVWGQGGTCPFPCWPWEGDPAPLQARPRAPCLLRIPSSAPLGSLKTRSIHALPFSARSCGRSPSSWVQGHHGGAAQWKCLAFKQALGEASGPSLYHRGTYSAESGTGGVLFQLVTKSKDLSLTRFRCVYYPFLVLGRIDPVIQAILAEFFRSLCL